jgi:hypothetical protein
VATASTTFDGSEDPLSEGGVWTSGPGSFDAAKKLSGEFAASASTSEACARYVGTSFSGAQYSKATCVSPPASGDRTLNLMTRIASNTDGDCYYAYFDYDNAAEAGMFRIDDTGSLSFNQLGAALNISCTAGDTFELRSNGSTHETYKNGSLIASRTDATYTTGQPGIGSYWAGTPSGVATAWEGGDLASATSSVPVSQRMPLAMLAR